MRTILFRALAMVALLFSTAHAATKSSAVLPGLQRDGSVLLPNQWSLRPVGKHTVVGDFPVNIALHPSGAFAAVLHSGWGQHEVRILNAKTGALISQVALEETFYGLTWSPDGRQLYTSGAAAEVIHAFAFKDGYLSEHRELRLRDAKERGMPAGIAISAEGNSLYVAETWGQRVQKISTTDGRELWTRQLAPPQGGSTMQHDEARVAPDAAKAAPFPYTCVTY